MGGAALNFIGQKKAAKSAKEIYEDLKKKNDDILARQTELIAERPLLDVDRTYYDDAVSTAQYDSASSGGRVAGEEQMRDSVREASANALASTNKTLTGGADAIAAISSIQEGENSAMRGVDMDVQRQRNENIETAKRRLYGVLDDRAKFNYGADMAEFSHNEMGAYDAQLSLLDIEKMLYDQQLAQKGAAAGANAQIWTNTGNTLMTMGQQKQQKDQQNLQLVGKVLTGGLG